MKWNSGSSPVHNRKLDIACALCGILALGLGLVTMLHFPQTADLPAGFSTPIISFEFASSESELSYLAGTGVAEVKNRAMMVEGTQWDMAFPFAYAGFLALLVMQLVQAGRRFVLPGVGFAILIVPLDINENLVLLQIIEALEGGVPVGELLADLHRATWLKWGAIAVTAAILAVGLIASGKYWSGALGGLTALAIGVCWVSDSNPVIAELMSAIVAVFFLVFAVRACFALKSV